MSEPASPQAAASTGQRKPYQPPRLMLPSTPASDAEKTFPYVTESRFGDPVYGPPS